MGQLVSAPCVSPSSRLAQACSHGHDRGTTVEAETCKPFFNHLPSITCINSCFVVILWRWDGHTPPPHPQITGCKSRLMTLHTPREFEKMLIIHTRDFLGEHGRHKTIWNGKRRGSGLGLYSGGAGDGEEFIM